MSDTGSFMSEDDQDDPPDDLEAADALPKPKHFVLTPVTDGSYHRALPTVTAVYIGCEHAPDLDDLLAIDGGILDKDMLDPAKLELCLFLPPVGGSPDGIEMETFAYELVSKPETIEKFWLSVGKVKSFMFAVSADDYYFSCRISTETSEATALRHDLRLLQ